jgi:hypothetical protein
MIFKELNICFKVSIVTILFFWFIPALSGQESNTARLKPSRKIFIRQDSISERKKQYVVVAEPDTNFTWEKYATFLKKISDTSKYVVLPLNEFRQTLSPNKIVIGLRHDVDLDLNVAYQFSQIEYNLGFRSTYFILHTAPYYLENSNNMAVHTENIIPILKKMQNEKHFEIGWHNDLVTLQVVYGLDPVLFLHNELRWLRTNGLKIYGTASHGSNYCKSLHYINYYFFEECSYPVVPNFESNVTVTKDGKANTLIKGKLADFDLKYEAYFMNNNKAFSDALITNGIRWNIGKLDLDQLKTGDRIIILLHPIHWHKASVKAEIESFILPGQRSSSVDTVNSTVNVEMPYISRKDSIVATFRLSPGAYAKVAGCLQKNRSTSNDFSKSLIYRVYAENRDVQREWTIKVHYAKNSVCDFLSFNIPDVTKSVSINPSQKTIQLSINEHANLKHLPVKFEVSKGAGVWIGKKQIFSNVGTIDFSDTVQFRVLSEDGINTCVWTVTVKRTKI